MKKSHFILLLLIGFASYSCKTEGNLGLNLVPDLNGLGVGFTDTFSILTTVVTDSSVRTRNITTHPIGYLSDNQFGTSQASVYTQFRPTGESVNFGQNLSFDSLILALSIEGFYGDTSQNLTLEIYELDAQLSADSTYYAYSSVAVKPIPLTTYNFSPRPFSRVSANEIINGKDSLTTLFPQIRIPLPESLALRFFAASGTSDLQNPTNFLNFFKGLQIKATNAAGKGVVLNINLTSLNTALSLYYKTNNERRKFNFIVTNELQRFSNFAHDYSGSDIHKVLQVKNHPDGKMYVQGLSGVRTFLKIPHLETFLPNYTIAINKAEIVFTVVDGTEGNPFNPPTEMVLFRSDSTGEATLIEDQFEAHYSGIYDAAKKEYRFGITRYLQNTLQKTEIDYGLFLMSLNTSTRANRAVLHNPNSQLTQPKLRVTYTQLK